MVAGTPKKLSWKCKKGHHWRTSPSARICLKSGCPTCAESGFNPNNPGWLYLMQRPNEQQLGITNFPEKRLKKHASAGWIELDMIGPHDGHQVQETEKKLKKWLKENIGTIPRTTENWFTSTMEVHSLKDLKEKSGIKTSLF